MKEKQLHIEVQKIFFASTFFILVKLLTRSQKIAYNLLHKIHSHGNSGSNSRENLLKSGDRVWEDLIFEINLF
jgi:hypothetical protein